MTVRALQCTIFGILQAERRRTDRFAAFIEDGFKLLQIGSAVWRVVDNQSGTRMILVDTHERVPVIGEA